MGAVLLVFGDGLPQSKGAAALLLRQTVAKTQKSSLRMATLFFETL
jgi:hypothetical protein